ncbi:MAG: SusC/RagA family TonB-linked outer membrane protein, partial [Parabacteroides sp.]|nr:SusC/RagA family TonB-linked outer membrane protein [Parabacteroides sp.]
NTSLQYYVYEMPTHLNSKFFWNMSYRAKAFYPVKNPDDTWAGDGATNVVAELQDGGDTKTNQSITQTQFNMDLALIKNTWHIKGDFTAKYSNNKTDAWSNYASTRLGPNLPLINFDMSYFGWDEYAQLSTWSNLFTIGNIYTDFSKTWKNHSLSALLGLSQEYERYESFTGRRKNMITPTYPTPQLAAGTMTLTEDVYEWAIRSGFYRLNYIYNNKYIFEFNGRYDGTSRFPKNDRFGFFPSVSGAWLVSEENFFKPLKNVLDYSKIRLSYGSLGNQDVNYYQYIATMNATKIGQLIDGDQPMGVYQPGLVSQNLTWEKISTLDIGLDLTFLSNRLSFSGDIFRRTTKDMLSKGKTLPSVLGTSEPKINAADLISKGWEVSLAWNDKLNLAGKPLQYNTRFILYDSRAFIKRFDNPTKYLGDYYEGQEIGEIWGLVTEGFFTSQDEINSHASQVEVTSYPGDRPIEPGDLKYKDLNGDGKINRGSETVDDPGDFKVIGNSSLRYNFGLDIGGDWNGWDLRLLFQGVGKRNIYPDSGPFFWGIYYAPDGYVLKETLDHWTPENPNAYLPRLKSYLTTNDLGIPQTRYLQNAAYVRMKNITLGYTLDSLLKSKLGIRIYFTGENLFEITSLRKPLDPESGGSNYHPFQRSYSFGLNITL